MLVPVDLLTYASAPGIFPDAPHARIAERFASAGKITILATQMTCVLGNFNDCHHVEIFSSSLHTPASVTGIPTALGGERTSLLAVDTDEVDGTGPHSRGMGAISKGRSYF
jgi:hypothetical protein